MDKKNLPKSIEKDSEEHAFQLGVYYLSLRPRTEHEMSNYLAKKGYEDPIIDKVIKKLSYYKYIDDEQFTINYISRAIEAQKKNAYAVKLELTKKGIPQEIIENCIPIFSYDIDLKIAKKICTEYFYQKSDLPYRQLKGRLYQLLARKGFTREIINDCLNYLEQDKNIQSIVASNKEQYLLQATKLAKEYSLKYGKKEDNPYLLQQKIKHALYRKGYSMGVINLAIENISDHLFPS
ncbi:MAG: hypothetical protein ACOX0L_03360 [Natronincolaceae bacterium]|nr:RecX family transcriptional regulator [Bacillota bacterium]NLK90848.1 hypothetical protein [Clostridiales bacterium]